MVSDKLITDSITVKDLEKAESEIKRKVHREAFGRLRPGDCVSKQCPLDKLDVSVDEHRIIRVSGRLNHAQSSHQMHHLIVMPKS